MTNTNLNLKNKPFLLRPVGKDYIWGGNRLNTDFNKNIDLSPLAETWECSTHPDGASIVASGEFEGLTLSEVIKQHPEFLGTNAKTDGELPILIKMIDAAKDLSVQVHPDDEYARLHENGSLGKNEMWYVLDAAEGATLIYGFNNDIDINTLKNSLKNGTVEKYLQKVNIHKGDVFFINAGTVHAIGAGALIAEIQQSSNLTYRLYDYDRTDKNGQKRQLHIEKALDVINMKSSASPKQPMRVLKYRKGCASELLCKCKYFKVERWLINTEENDPYIAVTSSNSFIVGLCTEGIGKLTYGDGEQNSLEFSKGDCIFAPANSVKLNLSGKCEILHVCI